MTLSHLIDALSNPRAYPHEVDVVEVRQTHISVVLLAGPFAYKLKKPVRLGYLDYTRLERRRHFCQEEVILNRRLAGDLYLGVVPVVDSGGQVGFFGGGEVIDWAVKMVRLPEDATFKHAIQRGELDTDEVRALAEHVASFHARAEAGPEISAGARYEVVAENALDNFEESTALVGTSVHPRVFERLKLLTVRASSENRQVVGSRCARGVPRDTHGDLRLGHVYRLPERGQDLFIIDCIEFSERYRYADPVSDAAFLVLDFARYGRRDFSSLFAVRYFEVTGDEEGKQLLPFYTAYRAAVKAKVEGLRYTEPEIPESERELALIQARSCWLLALGELEEPDQRPGLILIGGLPGSGKSTLARRLAETAGFHVVRSDVVRKERLHLAGEPAGPSGYGRGAYSSDWTERTYGECARRAEALLFEGKRVVVDASFIKESERRRFLDLSTRCGVASRFFVCEADPEVIRSRLENRTNDASDADWSIHEEAARQWEDPGPNTLRLTRHVDSGRDPESSLRQVVGELRSMGLHD